MISEEKIKAENIWLEYEPYVRRFCEYKLQSLPHLVDDCVADVFLDFLTDLKKGKKIAHTKSYLTAIASNKVKDIYEKNSKESMLFVPYEEQRIDSDFFEEMHTKAFRVEDSKISELKAMVFECLDSEEAALMYDRYSLKLSVCEIANKYETTENNIYQRLFRLKHKTRSIVKNLIEKHL